MKEFKNDIDLKAVSNYLTFLWSPGDKTMYKYVKDSSKPLIEINLSDLKMKMKNIFIFQIQINIIIYQKKIGLIS